MDGALTGQIEIINEKDRSRVRLIPALTATGGGILCAFNPDKITVTTVRNGRKRVVEVKAFFAPSELLLSGEKKAMGCNALISNELLV